MTGTLTLSAWARKRTLAAVSPRPLQPYDARSVSPSRLSSRITTLDFVPRATASALRPSAVARSCSPAAAQASARRA